ncbi:MAG TPA: anti-sigma factor [Kofleriaceae bacterium]|nr:anti-sigma factor [Kofleriaceae bacterium]
MTTCKTIQPRLTAYLDGELADDHGSVVRGHLRECSACREIARDEASLRDSLRTLAPIEPPASLWAGVQAKLAAAEVADAHAPRWRRLFARWTPSLASLPRLASGGLVAAAAVALIYWRTHRIEERQVDQVADQRAVERSAPAESVKRLEPRREVSVAAAEDVTADLAAEPARATATYGQAIEELMTLATEARAGWTDERAGAFDARVAALHSAIDRAAQGHAQQRAQRAMIRYLQGAVVRDDVLLASGGAR